MRITATNFSTKKSSVSCLLSILLSATALTAPVSLTTPSFGMEAQMSSAEIAGKMMDILEAETNKNNTSLQIKEIQPTIFSTLDNSIQKSSAFNLGHQQGAIYNIMYLLSQTADFNTFQNLANLPEGDSENNFLIKTTDKIRNDFDFSAQIIINGSENLKTLDIAQRVFLFHSLSSYAINSQAYREAFLSVKNDLAMKYAQEKRICEEELGALKETVEIEKNKIENDSNTINQKLNKDIENNKALLVTTTALADKITLNSMIQELETKLRENNTKKTREINVQSKKILDTENANIKKLNTMMSEHKRIIDDYSKKLSFIFEVKGASYIPLKKTIARYWNNEATTRTDYSFYQEMDLLIHINENIMPIARAKFFHALFKDFRDSTPSQMKRRALEELLCFGDDDRQMIQKLFSVSMESTILKTEPVTLIKNNSKILETVESKIEIDSKKSSGTQLGTLTLSPEVTKITNQVATAVVSETPKKKKEEPKIVQTKQSNTANHKNDSPQIHEKKEDDEFVTLTSSSGVAFMVKNSSSDQKKNGANTTNSKPQATRFGRKANTNSRGKK